MARERVKERRMEKEIGPGMAELCITRYEVPG